MCKQNQGGKFRVSDAQAQVVISNPISQLKQAENSHL